VVRLSRVFVRGAVALLLVVLVVSRSSAAEDEPPTDWVDPATGHRIVRLSVEADSKSFYFHQNAYSADGKKLVISSPSGVSTVDLKTHEIDEVVAGKIRALVTGRKTGDLYFIRDNTVWAVNLDSHERRMVVAIPSRLRAGNVAVNADETMIVCLAIDPDGNPEPRKVPAEDESDRLTSRWSSGAPMVMFTVDVATGKEEIIHRSHDWLNHLQCSPTDPRQIMFCHEGPWHLVERTWLIEVDGSHLTQVHHRTMDREIGGHEFFGADGKTVWYDLQTPRSGAFWLAGYDIGSGVRTWYQLARNEWSVHYNGSPDGKLFAGDGGGPHSVANQGVDGKELNPPANGQWIYLFRPELSVAIADPKPADPKVKTGALHAERLVDLSHHSYTLEPNVTFTPDGKWVVFQSNIHGPSHVYAVELAAAGHKANP
jgi:Oligogalacturonate lyase